MNDPHDAAGTWGGVAKAWDEAIDDVDVPTAPATDALLEHPAVAPGDRVLELACGPGSLGPTWSTLAGPGGRVVLSDLSPAMVEVAAQRTNGLANVELAVIDATAIDHPPESFDVVACRMGLMFAPEPAVALAEIRRVLAPGGRFGALTWAAPEHNPWMTCAGMAVAIHGLVAGGPPVGPGGPFSLGDEEALRALAEAAGFSGARVEAIDIVFVAPDVDAHLDTVFTLAGPLARALEDATPDQVAAVRATAAELVAPHATDDGVAIPGRALLVTGRA